MHEYAFKKVSFIRTPVLIQGRLDRAEINLTRFKWEVTGANVKPFSMGQRVNIHFERRSTLPKSGKLPGYCVNPKIGYLLLVNCLRCTRILSVDEQRAIVLSYNTFEEVVRWSRGMILA